MGDDRDGANGEDLVLRVPDGTVVKSPDGTVLADLVGEGAEYVVAEGGRGGLGNAALSSPRAARRRASPCSASRARNGTSSSS